MSLTIALLAFALAFIIFLSSPMEMNVTDILFTIISAGRFAVTLIIIQHFFNYVHYIILVICYLIRDTHPVQATPSDDTPVIPLRVSEVDPAKSSASSSSSSTIPTRNSRFEKHLKSIQKSEPLWQTYNWLTHEPLPDSESNQSIFSPHRKRNPEPPSETTAPKPRRKSNILRHNQTNEHRPSQNLAAGPNLPQIRDVKDADAGSADIAVSQGAPHTPSVESSANTNISTGAIPKDQNVESIAVPLQVDGEKSRQALDQSSPCSEPDTLQLRTSDSESSDPSFTLTSTTEGTASNDDKVEGVTFLADPEAHGLHSMGLFIPEELDDDLRYYAQIHEEKSSLPLEQSPSSSESDTLQLGTSDGESSDSPFTPTSSTEGTAGNEDKKVERVAFLADPKAHGLRPMGLFIPEELDDELRYHVVISKRMAKLSVRDDAEISLEISGTSIFSLPSDDVGSASIDSPPSTFVTSSSLSTPSLQSPLLNSISLPSPNVEVDAIEHCHAPSVPFAEPSSPLLVTPLSIALSPVAEAKEEASTEENESKPRCLADSDGINDDDQACVNDAELSLSLDDSENNADSTTSPDLLPQLATHEAIEGSQLDEDGEWDAHHPIPEQDIIMESQAADIPHSFDAIITLDPLPSTEAHGNFSLESSLSACLSDSVLEPIQEDITLLDTISHLDAGHLLSPPVSVPLISESHSSPEESFALNVWLPAPPMDIDTESVIVPDIALMELQPIPSNIAPIHFTFDLDTTTSAKSLLLAEVTHHIEESRAGVSFLEDIVMSIQDRSNETEAESPCNLSSTDHICNNIQDSDNMSDIFITDEDATLVFSLGWNGMTSEDEPASQFSENQSSGCIADELLTPAGSTTDVEIVSSFNSEIASEIATAPLVPCTEIQSVSSNILALEEIQTDKNNDLVRAGITSHTDFYESSDARPDIEAKVATPSELDQELPSPPISEITPATSSESDIAPFIEGAVVEEETVNRDRKEETPACDVHNSGETVPSPTELASCAPLAQSVAHIEAAPMNESISSSSPPAGSTTQPPPVIQKTEPITAAAPESKSATPSTPPPPMKAKPAPRPGFLISIKSRPAKPAASTRPSTGGRSNIKDALRSQIDAFVPVKPKQPNPNSMNRTMTGSGLFTVDRKGKGVLGNGHMSRGGMKFEGHDMDRSSDDDERDDENNGSMGGPDLASDDDDDDYAGSVKIHGVEISKAKLDAFTTKVRTRSHSHQWCSPEFLSDVVEKTMIECGIAAQIWEMASKSGMVDLESKRSNPRWYLMWAAKKWKFLPEDHRLKRGSREDEEDDTGEKAPKARKVVGLGRTRQVVVPSS